MKRFLLFVTIVALFLAGLYAWKNQRKVTVQPPYTPASPVVINADDVPLLAAIDRESTRVAQGVLPSVVSITTSRRVQTGYILDPYEFYQNHRVRGIPQIQEQPSLGSGVIVSKEGHILTNNHVVADTDKIQVELSDGRLEPAEIIGTDPETDIAILKINVTNLKPLPMGDSDEVKVGQMVFAIGNPLGLQETITRGIISAKSRFVDDSSLEYFQTDAAINQGNSGGPLVNFRGEIIGINTRIASQTGGSQGLGFAIPSNVARHVLEAILKQGRVVRSYLGVSLMPPEQAAQAGLNPPNGALVAGVLPGSPAEKADLKPGDVITTFNGKEIASIRDLHNRVTETPVNTKIELGVIRANGDKSVLTAEITTQPVNFQSLQPVQQQPAPAPEQSPQENILTGLKVAEISAEQRAGLPENIKGVMVTGIDPGSMLGKLPASLKVGDVVEEINHQSLASVAEFNQLAGQLGPGTRQALLVIFRDKTHSYLVLSAQ